MSEATSTMPQPNKDARQEQTLTIASPNPTIDDSKTHATDAPKRIEAAPVKADTATTAAPMKPAKKSKPKPRRSKPRS